MAGFSGYGSYAGTKWAVRGFADCLRNEARVVFGCLRISKCLRKQSAEQCMNDRLHIGGGQRGDGAHCVSARHGHAGLCSRGRHHGDCLPACHRTLSVAISLLDPQLDDLLSNIPCAPQPPEGRRISGIGGATVFSPVKVNVSCSSVSVARVTHHTQSRH